LPNGICIDRLPLIKASTLIIHGMKDAMVADFHATFLHERIVGSELHFIEDGKHNLHMKYHIEFNELVRDFIKRNTEPST